MQVWLVLRRVLFRAYGDGNPMLTGTLTGVKNSDPITASYATTAVVGSPIGTYPITATLNDLSSKLGNYTVTNTPALLTITPAPLSVVVDAKSKVYGDPNPTLTGTLTGVKNSDPITASYATTAVVGSPIGTYPITATLNDLSSKLGNYTVTNTPALLTITPAPFTRLISTNTKVSDAGISLQTHTLTSVTNSDPITTSHATTA